MAVWEGLRVNGSMGGARVNGSMGGAPRKWQYGRGPLLRERWFVDYDLCF